MKLAVDVEWVITWGMVDVEVTSVGSMSAMLACDVLVTVVASSNLPSTDGVVSGEGLFEARLGTSSVVMSPMMPVRLQGSNSPRFQSRHAEHSAHAGT